MASSRFVSSFARTLCRSPWLRNNSLRNSSILSSSQNTAVLSRGNINTKILLSSELNVRYMSTSVTTLSDFEATEKFTQLNQKSVLYFTATWCPPCKAIKPIYEKMSSQHEDIAFGKIDVDDNNEAALEFNISSVPTFVFFDGEDIVQRFSGADPTMLEKLLKELEEK